MKRLVRLREVRTATGLGKSAIYRLAAAGSFPKPVPLGERASAWDAEEVNAWIECRIALRDSTRHKRSAFGRRLQASA